MGVHAGLRRKGRLDLGLLYSEVPAAAAAVYTVNAFQAAPLKVTQESLAVENRLQAILVNSAIANACTGEQGLLDARQTQHKVAEVFSCAPHHIAVASTGLIGEPLPVEKIERGIELLQYAPEAATDFAQAILTTDTTTKTISIQIEIDGQPVTLTGFAKGSGMIHPNMATMLSFIATDAHLPAAQLDCLLRQATERTFNMITVDGDCSTNDMVIALANGQAGHAPVHRHHAEWAKLEEAFLFVCQELAKLIARDGEGATRLIEVQVKKAPSETMAKKIAKAVVGSNLVKTAVFGSDANWGRILCAVGYGAPEIDPGRIRLQIGSVPIIAHGKAIPFDEKEATQALEQPVVQIVLDLGQGDEEATAWGCDLTYDYVKINASYRT
jgi:glutamate N-acetyltransferase/amino-acid N-acetyltransferase